MGGRENLEYKVKYVEKVTNMNVWDAYVQTRSSLEGKYRPEKLEELPAFEMDATAVSQLLSMTPASGGPLLSHVNEALLWHGSSAKSIEQIATGNFKPSRSGLNAGASYGNGVYFAEAFNKADEYCRPNGDGLYAMLLCRCTLGRYCYIKRDLVDGSGGGNKWVKKESTGGWYVCRCDLDANVPQAFYDSLIGDRRHLRFNRFREVVVSRSDQIYPAFVVWYTRVNTASRTDSCNNGIGHSRHSGKHGSQ